MRKYEHFLIIISSPSGTGKSTLTKRLLEKYSDIKLSISATTRQPREGEKDGIDYYFMDQSEFDKKVYDKEFLEYEGIYGKSYGTLKSEVENKIKDSDVLLDVDWRGRYSVTKVYTNKTNVVSIFICPPSIKEVENRLRERGSETEENLATRLSDVKNTLTHYNEYDYVVVNDDVDIAFSEICSIIDHKRIANIKQEDTKAMINKMLQE